MTREDYEPKTVVIELGGQLPKGFLTFTGDRGDRFEVTTRKLRPPKPKAGDIITGKVLKETRWKAGTVVCWEADSNGLSGHPYNRSCYMLVGDGKWVGQRRVGNSYGFSAFRDFANFRVIHVA